MHALLIMSDTGGGHRAVSQAISAALQKRGGRATIADPFSTTPGVPLRRFMASYGWAIRHWRSGYGALFALTDRPSSYSAVYRLLAGRLCEGMRQLIEQTDPDVVVWAHPLAVRPGLDALEAIARDGGRRVPEATMVSDLVNFHSTWIDKRCARYLVATAEAGERLVRGGIASERIVETGLPVGPRFGHIERSPASIRVDLRLIRDRVTALLLAGGEGSGPVVQTVTAITAAMPELQLIVVCGRNPALKRRLEERGLRPEVRVLGFVDNVPELMHAADFVITKGGPQSIAEALAAAKPMIITDLLPGQEQGNGAYVVRHGAGFLALAMPDVLAATRRLAADPQLRKRLAKAARAAGGPDAADRVVAELACLVDGTTCASS